MPTIQTILMSLTDTMHDICMKSASTAFSRQYFESVNLYLVSYGPRFHCSKITGTIGEAGSIWSNTYGLAKLKELLRVDCIDTSAVKTRVRVDDLVDGEVLFLGVNGVSRRTAVLCNCAICCIEKTERLSSF
jgi:hypothetical protein